MLATLGSGGMASVYAAWDTVDEEWRALKVLLPMHAASQSLSERFEQEARLMMALSSPHLVKVFEVGRQDDLPYLVMEVVGARGGWSPDLAAVAIDQVVVHYDVAWTSRNCFKVLHDLRGLSCHFLSLYCFGK